MKTVLILGATSSIAKACAEIFAARKYKLFLASRDLGELERITLDLAIRYKVEVDYAFFDVTQFSSHEYFFTQVVEKMGAIDGVVMAIGLLDQCAKEKLIEVNFSGPVAILDRCARYLAKQKKGFIIGLSSVAGDRGRKGNYIYGASKSALTTYLQGLRNELSAYQIHVLTIKLGLIDTKMTFGSHYPLILRAEPKKTALKIIRALDKAKESVYIPGFWRIIMFIIRLIPEKIFKHLSI